MNKRTPIILGLILVMFSVWLQLTSMESVRSWLSRLDSMAYDMQLHAKLYTQHIPIDSAVTVIDVDDKSLAKEGRWPWPRAKLATLVDKLRQQGVVVIAFDMLFSEKEDNIAEILAKEVALQPASAPIKYSESILKTLIPYFDNDSKFAGSLKQIDTALGMSFLPRNSVVNELPKPLMVLTTPEEKSLSFIIAEGFINDIPILTNAAKSVAFINAFPDPDGIIRKVPLLVRYQDNLYPSLGLEAVRLFLLANVKLITAQYASSVRLEGIQVGNHIIPTDAHADAIIPFRGGSFTLPYFSATDVLHNNIPTNALNGKIVFVGTSATGEGDLQPTGIQSAFPGVEIHATIADGILRDTFSYKPAWSIGAEVFATVFLGLLLIVTFAYVGPRIICLLMVLIPTLIFLGNNWLWEKTGLILSLIIPMMLPIALAIINVVYGYLFETRKKEQLKEMFGQYVPAKHIDEMLKSSASFNLYGEDREMTVLFADIRDFTTISEPLSASQLKELLNEFLTPMTEIIFHHRGTIDKYVGDLIMAFWGAPLKDKKHSEHGLSAALAMQAALLNMNKMFVKRNLPEINIGIGLNTGVMSVGDMGSSFRRNYTVLGDAVNLASRVESLTKYYSVKIITTEFTQQHHQKQFVFRLLDKVRVKGKHVGIAIYEVVCREAELTNELRKEIALSEQALQFYFQQKWQEAEQLFKQLIATHPRSKFYPLMLNRITEFLVNPPPSDWDGIYTHASK